MTATKTFILRSTDDGYDVGTEDQILRSTYSFTSAFDTLVDLIAGKDLFDCGIRS